MKITSWFILAVAVVMVSSGCAQKIIMRPTSMELGRRYDAKSGALLDERTKFRVSETQVVAWVEFENAQGTHTARFKWYNPDEKLVLDSGPIPVTPDTQWYKIRRVWSVLPIKDAPASMMPGKWKVEVYLDKEHIDSLSFKLKE